MRFTFVRFASQTGSARRRGTPKNLSATNRAAATKLVAGFVINYQKTWYEYCCGFLSMKKLSSIDLIFLGLTVCATVIAITCMVVLRWM